MTIKSARMHLCNYLIAVVEAVESFIDEDLATAIANKVFTAESNSSTPANKKSKSWMP